ncbi:hypothetical protein GF382_02420 [Candidatus Falkowbacteria bacterium]|nr:hypothetical protein [Candidatus Falkowbacteria bacterium]
MRTEGVMMFNKLDFEDTEIARIQVKSGWLIVHITIREEQRESNGLKFTGRVVNTGPGNTLSEFKDRDVSGDYFGNSEYGFISLVKEVMVG